MKLTIRSYQGENDYHRCREFLRTLLNLNDYRELSWQVARLDYWRWLGIMSLGHGSLETGVIMWETPAGELVSFLNREGPGSVFLQLHPDYKSPELEEKMIATAERYVQKLTDNGQRPLKFWAHATDTMRRRILMQRGYSKTGAVDYQRRRSLEGPLPDHPVYDGYTVRSLGEIDELPSRSYASFKSFHPEDPEENYIGWEWYLNIQKAPLYRRDLDIVAIAPDGAVAAFCTIWFDEIAGTGYFEPVGTHPDHQRKGLASAVMCEGLKRLKAAGATMAYVGSWGEATHRLYGDVMGFADYDILEAWSRGQ